VPYFYHDPMTSHLYHWTGDRNDNVFAASALDSLEESWRQRSAKVRAENADRICACLEGST